MFALLVPDRRDRDKGWRHGTLCEAQEEPNSSEPGEVLWRGETHAYDAPNNDCGADEFGKGQLRHQVDEWILGHQLPDIEDRRAP